MGKTTPHSRHDVKCEPALMLGGSHSRNPQSTLDCGSRDLTVKVGREDEDLRRGLRVMEDRVRSSWWWRWWLDITGTAAILAASLVGSDNLEDRFLAEEDVHKSWHTLDSPSFCGARGKMEPTDWCQSNECRSEANQDNEMICGC